jgi:hypothetical protein
MPPLPTSEEGGEVSNSNGTLTVTNCTFGENLSDSLSSGSGSTTILHSTFAANSSEAVIGFAGHNLSIGHSLF